MPNKQDIEHRRHAKLEGQKLVYDTFKHLTTLSTGSILILGTFGSSILKNPLSYPWIIISATCFVVTMSTSAFVMFFLAVAIAQRELNDSDRIATSVLAILAFLSFASGIITFIYCITKVY